jgi:hypothetical protein
MATYRLAAVGVAAVLSSSPALALGGSNSASLNGVAAPTLATPALGGSNSASLNGVAAQSSPVQEMMSVKVEAIRLHE